MVIRQKSPEPFEYHIEGNKAVLLIHGFTGAPTEMAPLGEYLRETGYSVSCPLLKGHGTDVEDLEATTWKDWVGTAENALKELKTRYDKVYVVGFSMGGCIALYLAMKYEIEAVVSISTPVFLVDKKAYFTPILKHFRRYKPKPRKPDYGIPVFSYDKTPIRSVASLLKLIRFVKYNLSKITIPALVIQGDNDRVVRPGSAHYIYKTIKSELKEIVEYQNRSHMITVENGRQEVIKKVEEFLSKIQ